MNKRQKRSITPYKEELRQKAKQTVITKSLLNYHYISERICDKGGMEYKCGCCHEEDDAWMPEWVTREHVNNKKHKKQLIMYKRVEKLELLYEKAQEHIRELEKKLFEGGCSERIKAFLDECEPADTIIIEETTEERLASGTIIKNTKEWEVGYSSFDEIYDAFCQWSCNSFNPDQFKEQIKKSMIEYQEKMYGIKIGEYERNGTYDEPRFDFTFKI